MRTRYVRLVLLRAMSVVATSTLACASTEPVLLPVEDARIGVEVSRVDQTWQAKGGPPFLQTLAVPRGYVLRHSSRGVFHPNGVLVAERAPDILLMPDARVEQSVVVPREPSYGLIAVGSILLAGTVVYALAMPFVRSPGEINVDLLYYLVIGGPIAGTAGIVGGVLLGFGVYGTKR